MSGPDLADRPSSTQESVVTAAPANQAVATTPEPAGPAHDGVVLPPKRSRKRVFLLLALLVLLGAGGWKGYGWFTEGRFLVGTDDAYVKADLSIISAKVPGHIAAVPAAENAFVKAGDLLAKIDDGDYRIAVEQARSRVETQDATISRLGQQGVAQQSVINQARAQSEASKAQLASARADLTRTQGEFDRSTKLLQSTFGTQQRLDQTTADRDRAAAAVTSATATVASADSAVEGAKATLAVMQAQLVEAQKTRVELTTMVEKAERDLSFTEVRAPFDGVVGNRAAQPGQYVQTGARLLALIPLGSAYIEANFKETQLGALHPGQVASFTVDALPGREFSGTLDSIAPASGAQFSLLPPENATGNFTKIVQRLPVRVKVPDEIARQGLLRPGMSVVVDIHTRDEREPKPSIMGLLGLTALGK